MIYVYLIFEKHCHLGFILIILALLLLHNQPIRLLILQLIDLLIHHQLFQNHHHYRFQIIIPNLGFP